MGGLVELIRHEATTPAIIIAHGGYAHDFPIVLASSMKHNYKDCTVVAALCTLTACKISRMLAIGYSDWTLYAQSSSSREGDIPPWRMLKY